MLEPRRLAVPVIGGGNVAARKFPMIHRQPLWLKTFVLQARPRFEKSVAREGSYAFLTSAGVNSFDINAIRSSSNYPPRPPKPPEF
jgi:hypothetical protein